jgi:hypothetical protein
MTAQEIPSNNLHCCNITQLHTTHAVTMQTTVKLIQTRIINYYKMYDTNLILVPKDAFRQNVLFCKQKYTAL